MLKLQNFLSNFVGTVQNTKKNKMKVLVAVARKLLIAVWHVLHDGTDHVDFNPDCKASANNG